MAPVPEPPAPDQADEMVEGEPIVGEVDSEGEAMEGLPADEEGGSADACDDAINQVFGFRVVGATEAECVHVSDWTCPTRLA